jgi:hypothetical protein
MNLNWYKYKFKKSLGLAVVMVFLFLCACNNKQEKTDTFEKEKLPNKLFDADEVNAPNLFLADWVCTHHHEQNLCISPNFKYAYFAQGTPYQDFYTIMQLEKTDIGWTAPQVASFSGQYSDFDPFMSIDGNKLFFVSRRPTNKQDTIFDANIWVVERLDNQWGEAKPLGSQINSTEDEYYVSLAENGNIYFTSTKAGGHGKWNIYFSEYKDGEYQEAQLLEQTINSKQRNWDPYISVDEQFLIFTSDGHRGQGGGDLFISYRNIDGTWDSPENLGKKVNTSGYEYCPNFSPDGQWFFFSRFASIDFSEQLEKPRSTEEWNKFLNSPKTGLGDIYYISSEAILKK